MRSKKQEVIRYGSIATDKNGDPVYIQLPESVDVEQFYEYARYIGDSKKTNKPCSIYVLYKQTHTLDSGEMAKLINGVVEDAKELKIETMTPNEIANMLSLKGE